MLRRVALLALFGTFVSAARADDLEQRLETLLSMGVETQVPRESIRALGRDAVPALIALFERESEPPYVRLRALSSLGAFDDSRAVAYLEGLVRAAMAPAAKARTSDPLSCSPLVVRRALAARLSQRSRALDARLVAPLLAHDDLHVRKAAARALGQIGTAPARAALEARLAVEPSAMVRAALLQALR